ncbi:unnamed protein product [Nesidiocoris tenuis]|uniref:THAP-type domain-containing protein n=1 Tax=Nesidiocoris tenuis TaxID=355587 RepID=A0A6H5HLQ0_9HEMI|nr:unnamed protein product [Nesidiocoris tenuis]
MSQCFAYGCNHREMHKTCQFFRFPKDPKTFKRWRDMSSVSAHDNKVVISQSLAANLTARKRDVTLSRSIFSKARQGACAWKPRDDEEMRSPAPPVHQRQPCLSRSSLVGSSDQSEVASTAMASTPRDFHSTATHVIRYIRLRYTQTHSADIKFSYRSCTYTATATESQRYGAYNPTHAYSAGVQQDYSGYTPAGYTSSGVAAVASYYAAANQQSYYHQPPSAYIQHRTDSPSTSEPTSPVKAETRRSESKA